MKTEGPENHTKMVSEASWAAPGRPGAPRGPPLFPLDAFSTIFGRPGGVRRPSGEPLGVALGALGTSFGAPGGAFSRLGAGRGDNRTGSLKKEAFGIDFWLIFGIVFHCFSYSVRCVAGAVFFSSRGWFSATLFLLLYVVVRYARKGPPRV